MKTCSKCGVPKDEESDFYKDKRTGKSRGWCKLCTNADNIARAAADPQKHNARSKAWREANPEKWLATVRAWQARNPEKVEAARKQVKDNKYGIDFDALWKAQKGLCACCGGPMQPKGREMDSVCVDHDRTCCPGKKSCGKCVRGLIHWSCNLILGYAKDDPKILRYAAEYIERHPQ